MISRSRLSNWKIFAFGAFALSATLFVALPSSADSYNRHVNIFNNTQSTLVQFYGVSSSRGGWGNERLRGSAIAPGGSLNLNFDDGSGQCSFKFKAVFANGTEKTNRSVDVCQSSSYRFR